jgi:hypothetical protein
MAVGNEMRVDALRVRTVLTVAALAIVAVVLSAETDAQEPESRFLSFENATQWDWFEGRQSPATNWRSPLFDPTFDPDWQKGVTPFGYGEPFITVSNGTLVDQGQFLSLFLRLEFDVEFPDRVLSIDFTVRHDDGIIGYLNGDEIDERRNLPPGSIDFNTPGSDHEMTDAPFQVTLTRDNGDLEGLIPGNNVLAFSLHNTVLASSDLVFRHAFEDFELTFLPPPPPEFVRGRECDGIDSLDIGDAVYALRFAMGQVPAPGCVKSCDMDDSGTIGMTDGVVALMFLFAGGNAFPLPYPDRGTDPVEDDLTCLSGRPDF